MVPEAKVYYGSTLNRPHEAIARPHLHWHTGGEIAQKRFHTRGLSFTRDDW